MAELVALIHPLTAAHIQAAARVRSAVDSWVNTDEAFDLLRRHIPGFGPEAALLKAAAINQLYATNVYALFRMARHIAYVMRDPPSAPVALVERIAEPPIPEGEKRRRHISFASKFAHFFVDPDGCPIYDWYAAQSVKYHLGPGWLSPDYADYQAFTRAVQALRQSADLDCSTREMDHYLWLAGLYRYWHRVGAKATFSRDVRELFEKPPAEIAEELVLLEAR